MSSRVYCTMQGSQVTERSIHLHQYTVYISNVKILIRVQTYVFLRDCIPVQVDYTQVQEQVELRAEAAQDVEAAAQVC